MKDAPFFAAPLMNENQSASAEAHRREGFTAATCPDPTAATAMPRRPRALLRCDGSANTHARCGRTRAHNSVATR
jgi:hypothetical protein